MTDAELVKLDHGDEVRWQDPDEEVCSRIIKISSIRVVGEIVQITDNHGRYLECFANELS